MNSGRIFTEPRSDEVNILPLFTEIEKNNCFSIYTGSDLNNISKETIKNRFNWPLNSCSENVQAVQSMAARIRETIYRIFEHGKSIVNLRKNLVTV